MKRLSPDEESTIIDLYSQIPETVDQLPYTNSFEQFYGEFCQNAAPSQVSRSELWRALSNLRKRQKLPRKVR